ncbi:MFS transporter [Streptantibioticus cattleyicolor]|uniref:Major facilitator transporter n=1 Tax=Streptantibioticus cattleyicolor (strain ATCC 35852 / DSM 46488 / JCM 4925 / NBRC 14057 / NRRL 8057) TaxID=1003195 RepID=F8JKS0_STREN|nr:MFS transporter [Streptantibioticus cattleyicolor]AEW98435.1 major facilitator transporter [Streptantibioticus cattleyicolor NRRL 8057 = DSM 46488]CCB72509.1 Sugar phosphate permease [Streptantibioticus cattleyicolor NRRL 8057 = DSM 46488]
MTASPTLRGGPESRTEGSTAIRTEPRLRRVMAGLLFCFTLVAYLDKVILGLVAQPVIHQLHLSAAQFGFVGTAAGLLGPPAALLYSFVADRMPARAALCVLAVLWSLSQLPLFFAASASVLLATRFALGATEGPGFPAAHATVYTWFPNDRRGVPAALLTSGASLAKLALAPALTAVVIAFGWQTGFLVVGLIGLVWAAVWGLVGRAGPYRSARGRDQAPQGPRAPLRTILLTRTFIGSVIGLFVSNMLIAVVLTWLPSYFQTGLGFSQAAAGSLFGLPNVAGLVFLFTLGWWSDWRLRRGGSSRIGRGVAGGAVLTAGGVLLALIPLTTTVPAALLLVVLGYGLTLAVQSVSNPAVAETAPPAQRARVLAVALAFGALGGVISPWLGGVVLDAAKTPAQGYSHAFLLLGVAIAVGGVCYGLLVNPGRDLEHVLRHAK